MVSIGRRALDIPENQKGKEKYTSIVCNLEELDTNEDVQNALKDASSVFCALGTTRGTAGSAEAFKHVDYELVRETAKAAKSSGVQHFSLVSAQGASASCWYSNWKVFHGLLYMAMKGKAEEAVKESAFQWTTIVRPGMLDRGNLTRSTEKIGLKIPFLPRIKTSKLASIIVDDATKCHDHKRTDMPVKIFEMSELLHYCP